MSTLAARLKALSKRVTLLEQGKDVLPAVQAAMLQLEAALDELDKVLPPARRGRPKQPELEWLLWFVDLSKRFPGSKTDREILQWLQRWPGTRADKVVVQRMFGGHKGTLKTLQNKLARARKLLK